jgi:BirA family biotin operon repressor/biotin-[acetyl-CoA-carboxylase] ligase
MFRPPLQAVFYLHFYYTTKTPKPEDAKAGCIHQRDCVKNIIYDIIRKNSAENDTEKSGGITMAIREQILQRLRESGGFISGEELSERMNVSRTAIWKNINSLRESGYVIDSVTNRGYRLVSCPDCLSQEEISAGLETELLGRKTFCYSSIDSTNEEAKRQALAGAPSGSVFVAEQQTGGKGRLGRTWVSPPGTGLWFTVLLRPGVLPIRPTATTLLAGLAVCESIRAVTGCPAMIKWPNDIVIGSKKVCGILAEMSAEMERVEFLVVGIGVNVNSESFPEGLRKKATSLLQESGKPVRRVPLLQDILRRFETLLKDNAAALSPAFFEQYKARCITLGRKVGFEHGGKPESGTAEDISTAGELIVRLPDGSRETVFSGEVSVQGVYGE